MVGNQQGLPCGSIGTVKMAQKQVVDGFPASPHSIQIPRPCRQVSSTYEAILSDHPQHSTVWTRCSLPRSPLGLAWHQCSSGSMPQEEAVDGSMSQTHATSNSILPHALSWACGSTACLIPIGVAWGIIRIINNNWETICSYWFELATVQMQIWPNDHLSCGFEFQRSHLALK